MHFLQIQTFQNTPYDYTLFMDTDTCVCGRTLPSLFEKLREHDVVDTIDPSGFPGGVPAQAMHRIFK